MSSQTHPIYYNTYKSEKSPLQRFLLVGTNCVSRICLLANKDAKHAVCGGAWVFSAEF